MYIYVSCYQKKIYITAFSTYLFSFLCLPTISCLTHFNNKQLTVFSRQYPGRCSLLSFHQQTPDVSSLLFRLVVWFCRKYHSNDIESQYRSLLLGSKKCVICMITWTKLSSNSWTCIKKISIRSVVASIALLIYFKLEPLSQF